ncbi:MAG: hypothetical protein WCQ67_04380 [Treponema sp.]
MKITDIVIIGLVAAWVVAAVVFIIRSHKKGRSLSCGCCSSCGMCGSCNSCGSCKIKK